jgi:hypothetical protein
MEIMKDCEDYLHIPCYYGLYYLIIVFENFIRFSARLHAPSMFRGDEKITAAVER